MRQDFVAFFTGMEAGIREADDLPWLVETIDECRTELREQGFTLRADAIVFLYVNLRAMVVLPSGGSQMPDDVREKLASMIRGDMSLVFSRVMDNAADGEVSANEVFQAVGELSEQLTIRAEDFWGP